MTKKIKTLEFGKLETSINRGTTIIDNIFINVFMPVVAKSTYISVYLNGLMRCFGNKNYHFASVDTIAKDLNLSKRQVQLAYQYWEQIYVYYPQHEDCDEEGNIYLVKRVPRWLKHSPSEIKKISAQKNN